MKEMEAHVSTDIRAATRLLGEACGLSSHCTRKYQLQKAAQKDRSKPSLEENLYPHTDCSKLLSKLDMLEPSAAQLGNEKY